MKIREIIETWFGLLGCGCKTHRGSAHARSARMPGKRTRECTRFRQTPTTLIWMLRNASSPEGRPLRTQAHLLPFFGSAVRKADGCVQPFLCLFAKTWLQIVHAEQGSLNLQNFRRNDYGFRATQQKSGSARLEKMAGCTLLHASFRLGRLRKRPWWERDAPFSTLQAPKSEESVHENAASHFLQPCRS